MIAETKAAATRKVDLTQAAEKAQAAVKALRKAADDLKSEFDAVSTELGRYSAVSAEELHDFLKEPWCILPKSREEWWVAIPRWAGLSVGFLERSTPTYNIFRVDRYSHWFGDIPEGLRETLKLPEPFDATVDGNELKTTSKLPDAIRKHVAEELGEGRFRITRGHEFDILAALIEAGSLPFKPRPVAAQDLRDVQLQGVLAKLRDYQIEAWEKFLEVGAVGVYWPFGMGKTVLGIYAIAHLKGPKLVVCPTRTLVEQWEERLQKWLGLGLRHDAEVVTYHSWEKVKDKDWALVVFDEAHRLPANTFSRLASLRTKYRIGLSATPHREDGRENFIVALTGFPIGVDWTDFVRRGLIKKPDIEVRIVRSWSEKLRITDVEAKSQRGSTIVFCDSISLGAQVAARLKCPHVYGMTTNRLQILNDAKVAVVSRVGDEGLSLPNLAKVVEVDFHGSSRRQEAQRVGRLFHAEGKGEHLVLMTRDEFDRFEKRFLALEERGFKVTVKE